MVQSSSPSEIQEHYEAGDRNFQNCQLRRADLHGLDLSNADFSGADLSYANLRDANLSGANLQGTYLNEADLSGANLQKANLKGASLIKTYLIKANLEEAVLDEVYFTGAYLTKTNLKATSLKGAYLNGATLTGVDLTNAKYDKKSRFNAAFNPEKNGMKKVGEVVVTMPSSTVKTSQVIENSPPSSPEIKLESLSITVEDLLMTLNHLTDLGNHYLGNTMCSRYFQSSRPDLEWFQQFEINRSSAKVSFKGSIKEKLTPAQIELSQQWAKKYVKSCSMIFRDLPKMIEADQLVFPVTS